MVYVEYLKELWLAVIIGFLISGFVNSFIPTNAVNKYLGQKGIKPIFLSSLIGVLLPVCCFGSLPIAITMRKKGARLGPTLAFLVATPATSISALIVSWKLLGSLFTIYIFWAAIVMGLIMGLVGNMIILKRNENNNNGRHRDQCCHEAKEEDEHKTLGARTKEAFVYAFVTLPKEIGLELIIGIALASIIIIFEPFQNAIYRYLSGGLGYLFCLLFGLVTYVCSTASVPMADAFHKAGIGYGPTMVYLLAGPITSYGMIFVLKKKFGMKVLGYYLAVICIFSVLLGIGFEYFVRFLS